MELKVWRDKVVEYDEDPTTKLVTPEDKTRFMFLAHGDDEALYRDVEELTMERLRQLQIDVGLKISKAKKKEIKDEARRAVSEFREEQKIIEAQKRARKNGK